MKFNLNYLSTYKRFIKQQYPRISDKWLLKVHNKNIISLFSERISNDGSAPDTLKCMSYIPKFNVVTWTAYNITNFSFYIKAKDDLSTTQNSEIMVAA